MSSSSSSEEGSSEEPAVTFVAVSAALGDGVFWAVQQGLIHNKQWAIALGQFTAVSFSTPPVTAFRNGPSMMMPALFPVHPGCHRCDW